MSPTRAAGPPVTWAQTRAFRLARQHLSDPLGPRSLRRVVRNLGGVHAQVASAGELQCAVRAPGLGVGATNRALWKSKTIVKTWMMRGTLHYLDAEDLPVWAAASATRQAWRKPAWQKAVGLTIAEIEAAVDAAAEALDGRCLTREALADEIGKRSKNKTLDEHLRSGWGSILKIVAAHGLLCFGPNQGRNVTFVRPDQWLDTWSTPATEDAIAEVCRRYLAAHGPATRDEFARWWGFFPPDATKVLDALGDEVALVDREGDKAFVLQRDLGAVERAEEDATVRMLGMFDPYTLSGLPHDQVVPRAKKDAVYRKGAWVSQVVLRGGRVVGVWSHERTRVGASVAVTLFVRPAATKNEIAEALEPLAVHLGGISALSVS